MCINCSYLAYSSCVGFVLRRTAPTDRFSVKTIPANLKDVAIHSQMMPVTIDRSYIGILLSVDVSIAFHILYFIFFVLAYLHYTDYILF